MKASIALSAVVVLLTAGIATASPAPAGKPAPVGNFVTLHLGPTVGQFRGAVKSDVLDCIADRKVRIVLIQGPDVGPDMRVAKGFTDDRGHFNIQTTQTSGTWIAKVKHLDIGHGYVCAGAESTRRAAG
jgi:hypothetical protein